MWVHPFYECATLVRNVDSGEAYTCVSAEGIIISVPSATQLHHEPESALKIKVH